MSNTNEESSKKKREFIEFLEKSSLKTDQEISSQVIRDESPKKKVIHLKSLITENVSLFSDNPNYKLLAWLIVQLLIFSLFIYTVNIFKNIIVPLINSI